MKTEVKKMLPSALHSVRVRKTAATAMLRPADSVGLLEGKVYEKTNPENGREINARVLVSSGGTVSLAVTVRASLEAETQTGQRS
jgi:hypothetical protein